jgi:hypothetical protein
VKQILYYLEEDLEIAVSADLDDMVNNFYLEDQSYVESDEILED